MKNQFEPDLTEEDLVNIDNFNMYAKLLIGGQTTRPFNIRTLPVPSPNVSMAKELEEMARGKYGRPRQEVEEDITRRLRE